MSESEHEPTPEAIDDDQLPEDLRPDDNPLAEGLDPGVSVEGLLTEGKTADESKDTSEDAGGDGES